MSNGKGQTLGSIFGDAGRRVAVTPNLDAAPSTLASFFGVLDRLEAVLDAETEALQRNIPADMTDLGNRKRQGLLELTRSMRTAATVTGASAEIRARLARFAAKLERNRAALGSQLHAVREIADIIAETMRDAESDGTYSQRTAWS